MKFNIEVDITPQEVRKLLGLPDIEGMQKAAIEKIQRKISKTIDETADAEQLFQRILPLGTIGIGQLEKITRTLTGLVTGSSKTSRTRNDKSAETAGGRKKKTTTKS